MLIQTHYVKMFINLIKMSLKKLLKKYTTNGGISFSNLSCTLFQFLTFLTYLRLKCGKNLSFFLYIWCENDKYTYRRNQPISVVTRN